MQLIYEYDLILSSCNSYITAVTLRVGGGESLSHLSSSALSLSDHSLEEEGDQALELKCSKGK